MEERALVPYEEEGERSFLGEEREAIEGGYREVPSGESEEDGLLRRFEERFGGRRAKSGELKKLEEEVEFLRRRVERLRKARLSSTFSGFGERSYVGPEDPFKGPYGKYLERFAETVDEEAKQKVFWTLVRSIMVHGYSQKTATKKAYAKLLEANLV